MDYIVEITETVVHRFLIGGASSPKEAERIAEEGHLDGSLDPQETNVDERRVFAWAQR